MDFCEAVRVNILVKAQLRGKRNPEGQCLSMIELQVDVSLMNISKHGGPAKETSQ